MSTRSEPFARLLKGAINSIAAYEGKTNPAIEDDLGQQIGVSGATIQRWKSGTLPTDERAIEILAAAAVRRGFLDREWLQRFLHAARYPFADTLLDQLRPIGPARPRPPRVYHNLPAPTYSQFVMRAEAFAEVIDGLQQRSAVVLIVGLGGNGKTSLAREVAAHCLIDAGTDPRFDAVVWVSDKDRPGTTNLSIVLNAIARTLDYPGFTQFAHDEKLYEVSQLLKRQRVLVVIDNFETIGDSALLAWLLRLPEPSKAIITSREYGRAYRRGGWPVELRGMSDDEAQTFIGQRLRVLRIEKWVNDQCQLAPLLAATGSNPKAIEIALGIVKHERRPLQQVVDDLYAARGDLFDNLFTRAWTLLDEAARRVLLVIPFFPDSASGDALRAIADVQGFAFDRSVEHLTDLALLDVQQADINSMPRYTLHPLVRAFAEARLKEQASFSEEARQRWVEWYGDFLNHQDVQNWPGFVAASEEYNNTKAVIEWALTQAHLKTPWLVQGAWDLVYIRGDWEQCERYTRGALTLASRAGYTEQRLSLASHLGWLLVQKEGCLDEAVVLLHEVEDEIVALQQPELLIETAVINYLGQAMHHCDLDQAQAYFERCLALTQGSPRDALVARYYSAMILRKRGHIEEAAQTYRYLVSEAEAIVYERARGYCMLRLAQVLTQLGQVTEAEQWLNQARQMAEHWCEPLLQASVLLAHACLLWRQNRPAEAYAVAQESRASFQLLKSEERSEADELITQLQQTLHGKT